jgi:hypothetical protein
MFKGQESTVCKRKARPLSSSWTVPSFTPIRPAFRRPSQPASQRFKPVSHFSQLINQQIAPHLPFVAAIVHPDVNGLFFFFSVCFCFARHRSTR